MTVAPRQLGEVGDGRGEPDPADLDLDETLVRAAEQPLAQPHDFLVGPYSVYRRPHLGVFLTACAARFRLAVWSTAGDGYVREVVGQILPPDVELAFTWGRSRCVRKYNTDWLEDEFLKDLKKVKRGAIRWSVS